MKDNESAEIVCMGCGFVIVTEMTNQGPEWRAFDAEQRAKRSRVGAPSTLTIHDKGLSTMIDWHDRDIMGKRIPASQKAQIYRLRKWQRRIRVSNASERNLAYALSEINKIANNLNLPRNVVETASHIYRKAVKDGLIRGRSIQGVTAASIYVACRQCKMVRTLDDISGATKVEKKEIGRSYRFLLKEMNCNSPPVSAGQFITKYSNQLGMQGNSIDIALKILSKAKELKLTSGRGPTGLAAAISYISWILTGERRTQREIAEVAQVTEVTIRNRYKELVDRLQFIVYL